MADITETISRLRELEAKATPGPWEESDVPSEPRIQCEARGEEIAWVFGTERRTTENFANRALIVALRNAAPALLDAAEDRQQKLLRVLDEIARRRRAEHDVRRAEAERDRLRAMVEQDTAELTGPVYEQIKTLTAERDRLRERVAALEEGLGPFALPDGYGDLAPGSADDAPIFTFYSPRDQQVGVSICRGDFRRARALLEAGLR